MVPPTSQSVWLLPTLTTAAKGTTDTHKLGWVSLPPYRILMSCCDAVISDVIDEPAIDPVLSNTSASSRPVAAVCAVDAAPTVTVPMPSTPSSVGWTVAVLVSWTQPEVQVGPGLCTIGVVAEAPRYPTGDELDTRAKFDQNSARPSVEVPPVPMSRAATRTAAS